MVATSTVRVWLLSLLATHALGAVHEMLHKVPSGWDHVGAATDDYPITLTVALQEQNLDQLPTKLMAVSDPSSPQYGQHMKAEDVNTLLAPKAESSEAVVSWLKSAGVKNINVAGSFVNFATTVGTANKLLNTQFGTYTNDGVSKVRTTSYSVPNDLQQHIDLISPTTYFGKTKPMAPTMHFAEKGEVRSEQLSERSVALDKSCSKTITPSCIKQLYSINNYTADANSGSKIGFGSFLNQSARYEDLELFEKEFAIPSQNFSTTIINGGVNDQAMDNNHGEADLDVQYIIGTAHPLPVTQFLSGGVAPFVPNIDEPTQADDENEPYLNYYMYLLAQPDGSLPQVISNSYGDDEETVPEKYAKRVCNMIGQLGMRGISVLESSGDTGVGAGCKANDGSNRTTFSPQFPGTCPYITAVGGTQSVAPEIAWVASSGGFSNYFARPSYQDGAVQTYLSKYISPAVQKYYQPYVNFTTRGFPDVSAHSLTPDFSVIYNNKVSPSGGTSAACPVFAGTIALLNDALLRAGKPALGFLNPFLYSKGVQGLNDITGGGSVGCNGVNGQTGANVTGAGIVPYATWNATTGWDPVTGLGTPNFEKLRGIVLGEY